MKVALLVPNFSGYSGDARVVAHQAEELSLLGHEVSIFALSGDLESPSAQIYYLGMPKSLLWQRIYRLVFPLNFFTIIKWLPRFKEFDQIVVHLYPMTIFGFLAKQLYGVKYLFWFHGLEDPSLFSRLHERLYMIIQIMMTKLTLHNVDQAVSVSLFAKKILWEYMGVDSIVKYNEVNSELFHKDIDGARIRQEYGIEDCPMILSIGRLVPQKKYDLLIKSHHVVKETIPNAKLMIIGKPTFSEYYEELKKLSDDSIIFVEYVPNEKLPEYYAACDVYATCSYWENHNLPVLEAKMCGKPVVAFDIPAFKEEVSETDVLVEKGNLDAFARACINLILVSSEGKYENMHC